MREDVPTEVTLNEGTLKASLVMVHHTDPRFVGIRRFVPTGDFFVVGRNERHFGEGALDDGLISRRHTEVSARDGVIKVTDLESRNGTWVNGVRVESAEVNEGDVLGIGGLMMVVEWAPMGFQPRIEAGLVVESYAMTQVVDRVDQMAPFSAPVLLVGEASVGKERLAGELHHRGGRSPFLAIRPGSPQVLGEALRQAGSGTVFIDDIAHAPLDFQRMLAGVLERHELAAGGRMLSSFREPRIICSTRRDLTDLVLDGNFDEVLYGRLTRGEVRVPALRERKVDILPLAQEISDSVRSSPARFQRHLAQWLLLHDWRQNIEELRTVVETIARDQKGASVLRLQRRSEAEAAEG